MKKEILDDIKSFLFDHNIMTLAVSKDNIPWVCTVYYGIDPDLNFYIVTDPKSVHGRTIKENPNVSICIYDSTIKVTDLKFGIQASGTCNLVRNPVEVLKGLTLWQKNNPGSEKKITMETIRKFTDTRIFKIKPVYLKFFNKSLYGNKEYGEVHLDSK